ncbi:MAG: DUF6178 family protein [Nannocystaceae bacterium]
MVDVTRRLLRLLVDAPAEVGLVRALAPPRFAGLVRAVGLEDAGELLAMATAEQTLEVLDELLWRDADADEESLDTGRFAIWLEVLLEAGDAAAARRLCELPEDLLAAGLSGQLFVLDVDALGHDMAGASWREAELAERVLDEALHLEFAGFTLISRDPLGWDPTIAALLALDAVDHRRVRRALRRCRAATVEQLDPGEDGWLTILSAQETLEADARADRHDRRAAAGHVALADARAFLGLAAQTPVDDPAALAEDPVTRAYFRELAGPLSASAASAASAASTRGEAPRLAGLLAELDELDAELDAPTRRALPPSAEPVAAEDPALVELRRALVTLADRDPRRHGEQLARLAYLTNVLLTAGRPDGAPYLPIDAADAVLSHAARGLAAQTARRRGDAGEARVAELERVGVDGLFRLGWRLRAGEAAAT